LYVNGLLQESSSSNDVGIGSLLAERTNSICRTMEPKTSANALIELGVKTGLSLVFNILKINWLQNPCNDKCKEVSKVE
jgi:hypothetical protein